MIAIYFAVTLLFMWLFTLSPDLKDDLPSNPFIAFMLLFALAAVWPIMLPYTIIAKMMR